MLWSVLFYGVLGWFWEMVYASCKEERYVNRGLLFGPICPLYGVVITVVMSLVGESGIRLLLLLLVSIIMVIFLEWLTAYLPVRFLGVRLRDYSQLPGNVEGYICPLFSLGWAILCTLTARFGHSYLAGVLKWIPGSVSWVIFGICYLAIAVDLVIQIRSLKKVGQTLAELQELLGEKEKVSAHQGKKYQELLQTVGKTERRLFRAFPSMKYIKYPAAWEVLKEETGKN